MESELLCQRCGYIGRARRTLVFEAPEDRPGFYSEAIGEYMVEDLDRFQAYADGRARRDDMVRWAADRFRAYLVGDPVQLVEFIPADAMVTAGGLQRVIYQMLRGERAHAEAAAWAMDWIGGAGQVAVAVLPGLGESLEDVLNALATVDVPGSVSVDYLRQVVVELERGPFEEEEGAT